MHFLTTLACFSAAVGTRAATLQRREGCAISYGGPSAEAKEAVMNLAKDSSFGEGEEDCPEGYGWWDSGFMDECYICQDAYLGVFNSAADFAGVCFTREEFDETMDGWDGQRCTLWVDKHESLGIVYGNVDDFTIDDPDACWYC